ncbi:MAG: chorismate mutase [Candidatus Caenarcaniphilales bacterium]|nr:chorismate mutase [Candidatus Caenarcaniphilales bacterium]
MVSMSCRICALRGATTVKQDDCESIRGATVELIEQILTLNDLKEKDFTALFFTLTRDLISYNPATALRKALDWNNTPMICLQEAYIEGGLERCIRVIGFVQQDESFTPQHVYLHEAQTLRQDWVLNPELELP